MQIKFSKTTFAIVVAAVTMSLVLGFIISEARLAKRREFVTREIYAKAGLVMGDLYVVQFSSAAAPEVITEMLHLLVDAGAPTNWLILVECDLQSQGWEQIGRMHWLRHISLQRTNATDRDLDSISELSHLYSLSLTGTRITDVGIEKLSKLKELRDLQVGGTEVSEAQLLKLKEKLPLLDVNQTIVNLRDSRKQPRNGDNQKPVQITAPLVI